MSKTLIIQGHHNDLVLKRGLAVVTWEDDPEKNLGVVIPFNCSPDQVVLEVKKAVAELARELGTAIVKAP